MYPVKKLLDMSFVLLRNKLITIKNDLKLYYKHYIIILTNISI